MGEEGNGQRVATITITFDMQTGALNVNGPMQDKVLCYGMLELAKDVIRATTTSPIEVPKMELPKILKVC